MCTQTNRHTLQLALCGGGGGCDCIYVVVVVCCGRGCTLRMAIYVWQCMVVYCMIVYVHGGCGL